MFNPNEDRDTWDKILGLERASLGDISKLWLQVNRKLECLQRALRNPNERSAALRLLLLLPDDEQKKAIFSELVELAACGHSDIALCRSVIKSMPLNWVRTSIMSAISSVLRKLADEPEVEEEAYRRYAELLRELDQGLLLKHVETAGVHANAEVREIGHDFGGQSNE